MLSALARALAVGDTPPRCPIHDVARVCGDTYTWTGVRGVIHAECVVTLTTSTQLPKITT